MTGAVAAAEGDGQRQQGSRDQHKDHAAAEVA